MARNVSPWLVRFSRRTFKALNSESPAKAVIVTEFSRPDELKGRRAASEFATEGLVVLPQIVVPPGALRTEDGQSDAWLRFKGTFSFVPLDPS